MEREQEARGRNKGRNGQRQKVGVAASLLPSSSPSTCIRPPTLCGPERQPPLAYWNTATPPMRMHMRVRQLWVYFASICIHVDLQARIPLVLTPIPTSTSFIARLPIFTPVLIFIDRINAVSPVSKSKSMSYERDGRGGRLDGRRRGHARLTTARAFPAARAGLEGVEAFDFGCHLIIVISHQFSYRGKRR